LKSGIPVLRVLLLLPVRQAAKFSHGVVLGEARHYFISQENFGRLIFRKHHHHILGYCSIIIDRSVLEDQKYRWNAGVRMDGVGEA
jgi:hypothetical protein